MDEIEEIKSRIDIVDLVGHYVSLKKAGINYKGLCPFHHERTPSFMVNPERQSFKCFGCNKGGDIFTFIQETENIEFGDALRMLAVRAGVTLTPRSTPKPGEAPSEKTRYYQINALATQLFHQLLVSHPVGADARAYLAKRKISDQTIKEWRIGYAPRKKVLTDILIKKGFSLQEIQQAGKPDMFYDRIMFPIMDVMGNVVGFTGRILHQGEPKYLNTPETAIFRKSKILFGLEKAKQAIKKQSQVIMTEGQMDVVSAGQAGTINVVATSGTALTQDHLRILSRYDVDIVFAFDADGAGEAATKKAIDMAIADGLSIKVIPIPPPFKDIGDIVEKDPALWLELAKKPIPAIEWHIETVLSKYRNGQISRKLVVDEKKKVARELIPVLHRIPDTIEQAHYIQLLAKRLEVKEETIQQAMLRSNQSTGKFRSVSSSAASNQMAQSAQSANRAGQTQKRKPLSTEEALLGLLERSKPYQVEHQNLYNDLKIWYNQPINDLIFAVEEQYRGLSPTELKDEIELLVQRYQQTKKDQLKSDYATKISQAEAAGDREQVKQLVAEFQQLIK